MTSRVEKLKDPDLFIPDLLFRLSGWPIDFPGLGDPSRERTARDIIRKRLLERKHWEADGRGGGEWKDIPMEADKIAIAEMLEYLRGEGGGARSLHWLVNRACAIAYAGQERVVQKRHVEEAINFRTTSAVQIESDIVVDERHVKPPDDSTSAGDRAWCELIEGRMAEWLKQYVEMKDANYSKKDVFEAFKKHYTQFDNGNKEAIEANAIFEQWREKAKDNFVVLTAFIRALRIDIRENQRASTRVIQNWILNRKKASATVKN